MLAARDKLVPATGHAWGEWIMTKAATEDAEGEETRTCSHDDSHTETRAIPKLPHTHQMEAVPAVAPTCTKGGNIAYWKCAKCGKLFSDAEGTTEIAEDKTGLPPAGHQAADEWVSAGVTKTPGCTEQGTERLELHCKVCNEVLATRDKLVPATGHAWSEWVTTRAATEDTEGEETRTCAHDGSHTEIRIIPKLPHTHQLEAVPAVAPTCTEGGNIAYWKCIKCGKLFSDAAGTTEVGKDDTVLSPAGHQAADEWVPAGITKKPGCTEQGAERLELHCKVCNAILATRDGIISALGHKWGEWATTKAATETEAGEETRTCVHDSNHTETRSIPKFPHTHQMEAVPAVAPTCTEDGNIQYWHCSSCGKYFADAEGKRQLGAESIVVPATGHSTILKTSDEILLDPTCEDAGLKLVEILCDTCGEVLESYLEETPALGHIWGEWQVTKPATETELGAEIRICECDPSHTETRTIPMLGHTHTLTIVEAKAATCTEAGNIEYWTCSGCGKLFSDAEGGAEIQESDIVLPPKGHSAKETWDDGAITVKPTCSKPGVKQLVLRCALCGEPLASRAEIIPALGHNWGEPEYTWSDDFSVVIAERICRRDNTHIEQEICDEIEIYELIPAACEEDGELLYLAEFENDAFDDWATEKTEPVGHEWGEWITTKEATNDEAGEWQRTCKNDPTHVETVTIPKLNHVHGLAKVEAKAPTCTEEGNKEYWVCDQGEEPCGGVFTDAEGKNELDIDKYGTLILPAAGHSWKHIYTIWTDDLNSATFYFVCENDKKHTRELLVEASEEPPMTEDGKIIHVATAYLDGQAYKAVAEEEILHASYSYTEGQNSTWLKGSGKDAVFRVVRGDGSYDLDNDALTFELFTGIEVDGQSVSADNYTAEEGSVILSLKPAYLETLSLGWHTLKSDFIDGEATTRFLVAKPQPSPGSGSGSSQGSGSAGSSSGTRAVTSAKTGDDSSISLWIACALVSGTLMICCVQALKHKEKRRKKTAR